MPLSLILLAMLASLVAHNAAADEILKPRRDRFGDPLPDEAISRIGSSRLRHPSFMRMTLEFSADGKTLASGGRGVRLWDAATGKLRRRFDVSGNWTLAFAFTAEGVLIANAGLEDGIVTLQLFDSVSGKVRRRIELPDRATTANVTLSRDGKWLAYGHQNDVRLHDTASGREILRLPRGRDIAFTPDGKSIIVCDISDTIRIHDTANGKCVRRLKREGDKVSRIALSPDGRHLASIPSNDGQEPGEMSVWDLQTGKECHRLRGAGGHVLSAAFSPDGKYVAVGCQHHHLLLFDMATGKEVRRFPTDAYFGNIAFSPNGQAVAAVSGEGMIRLWETETGRVLPASADPFLDSIHELHFSNDGRRLLGHGGIHFAWQPSTGRELRRFPQVSERNWPAALSPDESLLVTADDDGTIHLWDAKTGREVRAWKAHDKWVRHTIFSPDGHRLISHGSLDNSIRVWDVSSGRELHNLPGAARMVNMAISPDGRWLAASSGYEAVLWDLATGREKKRFIASRNSEVHQLAFSRDSRQLAAVGGGRTESDSSEVQVWDVNGEQQRRWLIGHKVWVRSVAFSPDNRTLATGDGDGELFLWELATGRRRHRFVGHESAIKSLAFSPDGRLLAASSYEVPAFVWDVSGVLEQRQGRLSEHELQRSWNAAAGADAATAFEAIRRLAAAPEQTLPLLRQHLRPVPPTDLKRVRQLVEMLDNEDFSTRQKATADLEMRADASASTLRQILTKEKPSLEVRQRLRQILEGIESRPETLRAVRGVEVLEWIAAPEAVRLLDELARGAADARLTREAAVARKRLRR